MTESTKLRAELKALDGTIKALREQLDEMTSDPEVAEVSTSSLLAQLDQAETQNREVTAFEDAVGERRARVAELEREFAAAANELEAMQRGVRVYRIDTSKLREQIAMAEHTNEQARMGGARKGVVFTLSEAIRRRDELERALAGVEDASDGTG